MWGGSVWVGVLLVTHAGDSALQPSVCGLFFERPPGSRLLYNGLGHVLAQGGGGWLGDVALTTPVGWIDTRGDCAHS